MSGGLTTAMKNAVVDGLTAHAAFPTITSPLKLRLMTANGDADSAGTEVAGGSYAAQTYTPTAASGGLASNNGAITYTNMPACTVVGTEIWDSSGSPQRIWWGPASASKIYGAGDTATVAINQWTVSLT